MFFLIDLPKIYTMKSLEKKELMLCHRENILNEIETLNKALENINYKINYYDSLEI